MTNAIARTARSAVTTALGMTEMTRIANATVIGVETVTASVVDDTMMKPVTMTIWSESVIGNDPRCWNLQGDQENELERLAHSFRIV
jgi:hypothetical protein